MNKLFYFGMNFNFPGFPNCGARLARKIMRALETETGDRCTSRWPWHVHHEKSGMGLPAAVADIVDISRADYVILAPMTDTARGTHVEMGFALALDIPVYLYSKKDRKPTAFDSLCLPATEQMAYSIDSVMSGESKE